MINPARPLLTRGIGLLGVLTWLVFASSSSAVLLRTVDVSAATAAPSILVYDGGEQRYDRDGTVDPYPQGLRRAPIYAYDGSTNHTRVRNNLSGFRLAAKAAKADVGLSSRGLRPAPGTRVRPSGISEGWRIRGTKTAGGTRYYDPSNPVEIRGHCGDQWRSGVRSCLFAFGQVRKGRLERLQPARDRGGVDA